MEPKYFTGKIEGVEITMHMTGWADKLAEYYYMSRSQFDKILSQKYNGDLQKMIDDFQTPYWREKKKFIYESRRGASDTVLKPTVLCI